MPYFRFDKTSLLVPIQHTISTYFFKINFNIILQSTPRSSEWTPFPPQKPVWIFIYFLRAKCIDQFYFLWFYLSNDILLQKFLSFLCSFLRSLVSPSHLGPNTFLNAAFPYTIFLYVRDIPSNLPSYPLYKTSKIIRLYFSVCMLRR